MAGLGEAGICYRRCMNLVTESHYPHFAYNFRIGWESNGSSTFEAHEDTRSESGYAVLTPVRRIKDNDDLAENLVITLEAAVKHFRKLKDNCG